MHERFFGPPTESFEPHRFPTLIQKFHGRIRQQNTSTTKPEADRNTLMRRTKQISCRGRQASLNCRHARPNQAKPVRTTPNPRLRLYGGYGGHGPKPLRTPTVRIFKYVQQLFVYPLSGASMTAKSQATFWAASRLCITMTVSVWMFYLCLLSRTMNPPGNPAETSAGPYLLAFVSGLLFLVAWRPLIAVRLWILGFFCAVIAADLVATREERQFVEKYKLTGKGPTPRQTFRSNWLAYDASTKHLSGGD